MELAVQILSAFLLGLLGGANPGPILASAFTEALRIGFFKSLRVIFMALVAESIVAAFILFAFFSIDIPEVFFYLISFAGAGVLVWLALRAWNIKEFGGGSEIFSFKKIFLLTIFNGPFWVFWVTISVPQAFLLKEEILGGHVLFLVLFESGWFLATVVLTFLFSRFRQLFARKNLVSVVFKFFAFLLLLFALKLVLGSTVSLFG